MTRVPSPAPADPARSASRTTIMLAILAAVVLLFSRQRQAR